MELQYFPYALAMDNETVIENENVKYVSLDHDEHPQQETYHSVKEKEFATISIGFSSRVALFMAKISSLYEIASPPK